VVLLTVGGVFLLLAALTGVFFSAHSGWRSGPAWYVEERYAEVWGKFLEESSPPFTTVRPYVAGTIPPGGYGFIISGEIPPEPAAAGEGAAVVPESAAGPVFLFPDLAGTREYRGALLLAADPWMIFRKTGSPQLRRQRVESLEGGEGLLILSGGEEGTVHAWLCQLLQEPPGTFPADRELWEYEEGRLFMNRRFYPGSVNYTWADAWALLWRTEGAAWVYAPLSVARERDGYEQGLLDATRFPIKNSWNEYGMQADLLWARILEGAEAAEGLEGTRLWLLEAGTQERLAGLLGWIPVNPRSDPYDTLAWEARSAWESSTYIWQGVQDAGEGGK
jgi:hypothetical protein